MRKKTLRVCLALAVLLLFVTLIACSAEDVSRPLLTMVFLDVGQGDATLIRTPAGDCLVDAGTEASQLELCMRLRDLGVEKLTLAVFTHPDEDHIGGADGVLTQIPTQTVWYNGTGWENPSSRALMDAAYATGATVQNVFAGGNMQIGDTTFWAIYPEKGIESADSNNSSIVLMILQDGFSALMTGDAEAEVEERLVNLYQTTLLKSDVLKVGHHGSYTSSSQLLLEAVTPRYAVISSGRGNSYGHPHGETLVRLQSAGAEVLRTDLLGEIVLIYDGSRIRTTSDRR